LNTSFLKIQNVGGRHVGNQDKPLSQKHVTDIQIIS